MKVSRSETSLKRDSSTGIFLWILGNFSKNLIYKTCLDDYSWWLLCSNQSFIHWSHYFSVFPSFFPFIIDNCNYGSLLRKCLKTKIFYFLQYCIKKFGQFCLWIICWRTLELTQNHAWSIPLTSWKSIKFKTLLFGRTQDLHLSQKIDDSLPSSGNFSHIPRV